MLSVISSSRKGSLSLNHADTSLVNVPLSRLSTENCGKVFSSRFSRAETVLRGSTSNTTASRAKAQTMMVV